MQTVLQDGSVMVCGRVPNDAQRTPTRNGGYFTRFGVKVGERGEPDEKGRREAVWVNCQSFDTVAQNIHRGDTVFVIGRIESHEYQGQERKNLVAEFIQIQESPLRERDDIPSPSPQTTTSLPVMVEKREPAEGYRSLQDEEYLPF